MEIKKYIKKIFAPAPVAKRAKAMKREKLARVKAKREAAKARLKRSKEAKKNAAKLAGKLETETKKSAKNPKNAKPKKNPAPLLFPKPIEKLQKNLGYKFADISILREALTHPGTVGTAKDKIVSNQRLEFLGDAVLQGIITDTVYKKFPDFHEGKLTKIRIVLTRGIFLSDLSRGLEIPKYLSIPKGSEDLRKSASAAEDVFEAVVGAIYLDSDFETTKKTVLAWYKKKLDELPELVVSQNPKGTLQELAAKRGEKVEYVLLSQSGPDHKKIFEVEVRINGATLAKSSANSKKAAEGKAAEIAIPIYEKSAETPPPAKAEA